MQLSLSRIVISLFVALSVVCLVEADWFDDLVNGLHEKIISGADFIKDEAAPKVRQTFIDAKDKLKNPETHREIRNWINEITKRDHRPIIFLTLPKIFKKKKEAIPAVKEKVDAVIAFLKREVVPELQEIKNAYDIAAESN
uniref:SXP/RAL-2 family protein Ani s 5-like cation-binding domain-containing protein n=1 Tax=Setaria digitata TaxID=48799 RepID=A0A915PNI0_9BILA